jgi:hypothetical protein
MGEDAKSKEPVELFYSYAHKDEKFRTELEKHLSILKRNRVIADWHDRKIIAGHDWEKEIDERLNTAKVILLLVSADFLASDYCYGVEMNRALERHKAGDARVIPVIIRNVYWKGAPFGNLQALPTDARAVGSWRNRDRAFTIVVKGIIKAVEELQAPTSIVTRPSAPSNTQITSAPTEVASSRTPISNDMSPSPIATKTPASPTVMTYTFNVYGLTNTNVVLRRGDKVKIDADGVIDVGPRIGEVMPEGKRSFFAVFLGVISVPILIDAEKYNIVSDYPHGMLMYRIQPEGSTSTLGWKKCGKYCRLSVEASGTLELEVNDNDQENNSGEFQVRVTVERY